MDDASSNANVPAPVPALGFSYSVELTPGRSIVMQTHLPNDVSSAEIDTMLDKVASSIERQKLRATDRERLEGLRQLEEQQSRQYERFKGDFDRLEKQHAAEANTLPAGRRTAPDKSPAVMKAEQAQRQGAIVTLETGKKDLDDTRAKIKALEVKVAAHDAAPSGG